jgi:hypothetical protein
VLHGGTNGASHPAIGEFNPIEGTMAEYELASDLTGIFVEPPPGQVLHFGGPIDNLVLSGSVWATRQQAVNFFAVRAGDGITEFVRRLTAPHRDPDLSYQLKPVEELVVGPAAHDFELRPRGEADGAVLLRTPGAKLPPADSAGLILAARLSDVDDRMLYEFRDAMPREVAAGAQVIHLHSIFTTAQGLAELARN